MDAKRVCIGDCANCPARLAFPSPPPPKITQVVCEFLTSKQRQNLRRAYLVSLRQTVLRFASAHPDFQPIGPREIEAYIASRKLSPSSAVGEIGRLGSLFAWAVRRGHIRDNPFLRLEKPRIERAVPRILTPDECRSLLESCRAERPESLPFLALALFAGIRPDEITRLTWADVDLDRALVTVSAAASKVRRRRLVPLSANAVAWLRLGGSLPITRQRWKRARSRILERARVRWSQDVLRHTAASMMLARDHDAQRVALALGNSPGILLTHYRELLRNGEHVEFWNINPHSV